jgi:hypothetical protein
VAVWQLGIDVVASVSACGKVAVDGKQWLFDSGSGSNSGSNSGSGSGCNTGCLTVAVASSSGSGCNSGSVAVALTRCQCHSRERSPKTTLPGSEFPAEIPTNLRKFNSKN